MSESNPGRTAAIVSYITLVGCFIAITMNLEPKHAFARFHIRQAFGIHLIFHAIAITLSYSGIVYLSIPLYVVYFVLWGYGFTQAMSGKTKPLPILGVYFQKWFTFIS